MEVPLLVTDFLDRAVRIYPEKLAIVDGDRRYTYREFNERVDRLSNALLDLGLRQGDRVCMLSPNSHFYLEIHKRMPLSIHYRLIHELPRLHELPN